MNNRKDLFNFMRRVLPNREPWPLDGPRDFGVMLADAAAMRGETDDNTDERARARDRSSLLNKLLRDFV